MYKDKVLKRFMIRENFFSYSLKFTILLGLVIAAPFFHFQAITGTVVNAVLILAVFILGRKEAVTIGIFPSLISVITGLLIPAIFPLVPFIILGNVILVFIVGVLKRESYWKGVIAGSIAKFLLLYISGIILVKIFELGNLTEIIGVMFGWQQLLTALSGGVVAYAALKILKN